MSESGHHEPRSFLLKYVFSTDHKVIGLQFMFLSLLFVIVGGLLALGVRYQLAWPNQHVPFAKLLPGKMTTVAPEANLALWKKGHTLRVNQEMTVNGQMIPKGAKAMFVGVVNGELPITVPVGARVKTLSGTIRTLADPINAFVDRYAVMADYNYKNLDVRGIKGTTLKIRDDEGRILDNRALTLVGLHRFRAGPEGEARGVISDKTALLPIRLTDAYIDIKIPTQQVVDDRGNETGNVEVPVFHKVGVMSVTYEKQTLTSVAYLQLFTMHASLMIFFVIIPMLVGGFANFLVPLMIGSRDMAFPRINLLSFWLAVPAGVLMMLSFWVAGGPAGGGWTMYPPLSATNPVDPNSTFMQPQLGTTLWIVSVGLIGFSSIVGAINYITTIVNMRAPGMDMFRLPLTVWSVLITSILALFATPMLTAAMIMLLLDRTLGTHFFNWATGGQPLMWQHLFWFYSHPAVYIMILPAMGLTSDILAVHARKAIYGYKPMVLAICAIAGLGFIVWGHHMFQSGMNPALGMTFMAATIMIAVPSAIKVFNWLGTLWGGNIRFTPAMLNAIGFVSMFVIGGLSGIFMAAASVDVHIHDTYFIVAHIHYVLFGGSLFGIFAGIYHWFPKMFGRQLNYRWGVIHFVLTFVAFNGTFFLMHVLGIGGAPRRYASHIEYPTLIHWQPLNAAMTIFALMLGMAQIPFIYNFFVSLPRKLGRAMAATFLSILGLPTIAGLLYWDGFKTAQTWIGKTVYALFGQISSGGYGVGQTRTGYFLLLGAGAVLLVVMLRQLNIGGKIATVFLAIPLLLGVLYGMNQGELVGGERPEGLRAFNDTLVSLGISGIFIAVIVVLVFLVWAVGGALRLPALVQRCLYVGILPLFLAPAFLKQDVYLWLGLPEWFAWRWMILVILALPGIAYLAVSRPRDAFGFDPGTNPWLGNSLEWATTSPPPHLNFDTIPTVYRGPYEYSSPVLEEDYLPQLLQLPEGVVESVH